MTMTKKDLVVVGNGMVGHRFLELLLERGRRGGRLRRHRLRRGAAARLRPRRPLDVLRRQDAPTSWRWRGRAVRGGRLHGARRRRARAAIDRARAGRRRSAGGRDGPLRPAGPRDRLRIRSCRRSRGARRRAASSTARSRIWRRSAPAAAQARGVGAVIGGGLLGLEAANALQEPGARDARRRVRAAPDGAAARRDRRRASCAQRIEALGVAVHTAHATTRDRRRRDGARRARCASPTAASWPPTWSSSPPASARATSWRAPPGCAVGERGGIVIDDRCRTSDPGHLRHRRVRARTTGAPTAWSRPATRWRDVAAARRSRGDDASAFTGFDMSTKLKLLGVDVASFGDAFGAHAGRARASASSTAAPRVYKKLVLSRRPQAPARRRCWSATPPATAQLLQLAQNQIALPPHPEDADPAAARRRRSRRAAASTRCPTRAQICSCNNVTKGAICARHPRAEADRRRRASRRAPRPAPAAAPASRWSRELLEGRAEARRRRRQQPPVRALPAHRARSCITWSASTSIKTLRRAARAATASGRGCEICKPAVASILASAWNEHVLDAEARGRCRTPTIASWPTSSATAPTRSCRACRAARSRPTS